jgi:hypothetical protein
MASSTAFLRLGLEAARCWSRWTRRTLVYRRESRSHLVVIHSVGKKKQKKTKQQQPWKENMKGRIIISRGYLAPPLQSDPSRLSEWGATPYSQASSDDLPVGLLTQRAGRTEWPNCGGGDWVCPEIQTYWSLVEPTSVAVFRNTNSCRNPWAGSPDQVWIWMSERCDNERERLKNIIDIGGGCGGYNPSQ